MVGNYKLMFVIANMVLLSSLEWSVLVEGRIKSYLSKEVKAKVKVSIQNQNNSLSGSLIPHSYVHLDSNYFGSFFVMKKVRCLQINFH